MKIAVFGGSFDPVTKGHVDIVRHLEEGGFGKVIVLPAFLSPFKREQAASALDRVEMLKLAFEQITNYKLQITNIDTREIEREGVSYTYLTMREIAAENAGAELWFVIGSEMVGGLGDWRNIEELRQLTNFLIVPRNFDKADCFATLTKTKTADFVGLPVSSSFARVLNAFDRVQEAVPSAVADYIRANNLYGDYKYITSRYGEFGLSASRIEHTLRVCEAAIDLAKKYGVNIDEAITAALLHDIGKYVDIDRAQQLGIDIQKLTDISAPVAHSKIGADIATKAFGVNPEVAEAIRQHTTGAPAMTDLSKVVYLADYIEKGRDFEGLPKIREATQKSLDKGMLAALEVTLKHLENKTHDIDGMTRKAYEYYKRVLAE